MSFTFLQLLRITRHSFGHCTMCAFFMKWMEFLRHTGGISIYESLEIKDNSNYLEVDLKESASSMAVNESESRTKTSRKERYS